MDTFEYVVIGSGAGGGTVAARLAEYGHTVLLLEAGGDPGTLKGGDAITDENRLPDDYDVPVFHAIASENKAMKWDFWVKHYKDPALADKDDKYYKDYGGQPNVRIRSVAVRVVRFFSRAVSRRASDRELVRAVGLTARNLVAAGVVFLLAAVWASVAVAAGHTARQTRTYSTPATARLATAIYDPRLFDGGQAAAAFARTRAAGATYARLVVNWGSIAPATPPDGFVATDPTSPGYSWDALDAEVGAAESAGLTPILFLQLPPVWAYDTAPTAVNMVLQGAMADVDAEYQTIDTTTNLGGEARTVSGVQAKFLRIKCVSSTGGTGLTAKLMV